MPGFWAGFYLVFLCPGCGLVLPMLGSLSVGFGLVVLYRANGPFSMFLGEVLSVWCLLW